MEKLPRPVVGTATRCDTRRQCPVSAENVVQQRTPVTSHSWILGSLYVSASVNLTDAISITSIAASSHLSARLQQRLRGCVGRYDRSWNAGRSKTRNHREAPGARASRSLHDVDPVPSTCSALAGRRIKVGQRIVRQWMFRRMQARDDRVP